MRTKEKNVAILVCLLAAVGIALAVNNQKQTEIIKSEIPAVGFSGNVETYFCAEFKPANGEWQDLGCEHNVFTDAGRNHVKGLLGGTVTTNEATLYLALGNGTAPVAGSTTLNGEQANCDLGRKLGDYYDLGTGWWEVNTTYTYSCSDPITVNTTAAFNQASSGTLFAGGTITSVTFTVNGDQLRLRHNNTISEA